MNVNKENINFETEYLTDEQKKQTLNDGLARLKAAGFKMTKKRQEILEIFIEEGKYLRAKEIHDRLTNKYPSMSYNTTYRNIYDFIKVGILESTEYNQEQLFKINCMDQEHDSNHHHHHFICRLCGLSIPLKACPMDHIDTDLSDVLIESHRFEVFGLCATCKLK
ncbi:Fur family transcriptional regulator [Fundicoccus culcitae]|uniref:Transcriptional repressor n=1 Tax=Fundicoccus culcitae TaxID=2969821 RepID=A0ABY5P6Z0_9LACT|nr:transcriptional repressor [Fundicoccus culcitae]UUX34351.1 transcriptional repressor [Fundicoccus culcitae]